MKKKQQEGIWFVVITLVFAVAFYWGVKELLLPHLPEWLSSFLLYKRQHTYRHTNLLMGISGFVGAIGALFVLNYFKKKGQV